MSKPGKKKEEKKKLREERLRKQKALEQIQEHVADLYYRAESDALKGNWPAAVRGAEAVIKSAPNHTSSLRLLAKGYYELKNSVAEAHVLRRLVLLAPQERVFAWNLIGAEANCGNFEAALSRIREFEKKFRPTRKEAGDIKRVQEHCRLMLAAARIVKEEIPPSKPAHPTGAKEPARAEESGHPTPAGAVKEESPPDLPLLTPQIGISIDMAPAGPPPAAGEADGNALLWLRQRLTYAHLQMQNEFEELICIPYLRGVLHFAYQAETVRKVLKVYHGRVLLSDEVGLGKTIEASMVIKEYLLRGMVKTVLVLCPPSLVHQWHAEFRNKFGIHAHAQNALSSAGRGVALWAHDIIIASIHSAKGRANRERVLEKSWDMVVVDEAHHLRNRRTLAWSLVNSIKKKFLLLLSATPVQNDLAELYNLITLLKPGAFPPEKEFLHTYSNPKDPRIPRNADRLRLLMRECMIRNTRAGSGVPFPKRFATTITVRFNEEERNAYDRICDISHELSSDESPRMRMALRILIERAGAHIPLAIPSLKTLAAAVRQDASRPAGERESIEKLVVSVMETCAALPGVTEKIKRLIDLIKEGGRPTIVFCRHTATVQYIAGELLKASVPYSAFHGGLSREERLAAIESFRAGDATVLVSSETGGEGQNLQFCNALINFDLPWNPMQIEQRIGRIHRIGQDRDVFVFNFCYEGTLEEKILGILETKIRMFELVIGEVDSIVGNLDERGGFSELVLDLWVRSGNVEGRSRAFEELGEYLAKSREEYLNACRLDEGLFGKDMET